MSTDDINMRNSIKKNKNSFLVAEDEAAINDSLNSFAACFCCNPLDDFLPEFVALQGQAFDLIVVQSPTTGRVASSDFLINFDHPTTPFPPASSPKSSTTPATSLTTNSAVPEKGEGVVDECEALLEIDDEKLGKVYFPIVHDAMSKKNRLAAAGQPSPTCDCMDERRNSDSTSSSSCSKANREAKLQQKDRESEHDALLLLIKLLKPGKNHVRYLFRNQQRVMGIAHAAIFLWSDQDRVVVCDVDGTITKTNVRGIYDSIVTEKYAYCHDRVCQFLSLLKDGGIEHSDDENPQEQPSAEPANKVNVLYLTSRPLLIAQSTRKFLSNLRQPLGGQKPRAWRALQQQNERSAMDLAGIQQEHSQHRLPEGPLLGFGGRFMDVMKMELVSYTVHLFKASLLMEQVVTPFCQVAQDPRKTHQSLFMAGFGNTLMDVQAYHMVGMDLSQIYLIDKKSRIVCLDATTTAKLEQKQQESSPSDNDYNAEVSKDMLLGGSKKFLLDTQKTDAIDQHRPCLKTPLPRKSYKNLGGTTFNGYHDGNLASHVFAIKKTSVL